MAQVQTEGKKATTSKKNSIYGFLVGKLNRKAMESFVEDNGLDDEINTSDETTDEQLAVSIAAYCGEKADDSEGDDNLNAPVKCDVCSGVSLVKFSACPFCGDNGGVEASSNKTESEEEAEENEENEEEEVEVDEDSNSSESDDEVSDEDSDSEDDSDSDEESDESDDEETEEGTEEEEEASAKPAKAANKKTEKKMSAEATNGISKANGKGTVHGKTTALQTVKELDKAVAEIVELKSDAAENFWALGQKLLEINKKHLWKLRTDDKGKSKYKTWEAFVHAELNMSTANAYKAIDVAREYKDSAEVRALGHTKAALILNAAPKDRESLKKKAKAGATKRELMADVKKSREKNGSPKGDSSKAKAGKASAEARAKNVAQEKISITNIEGVKTIKLHKLPADGNLKGVEIAKLPVAVKVADQPFGRRELSNGVVQYFFLLQKEGELLLKIQTKRTVTK